MFVHVAFAEPRPTCLAPLQKAIFSASLDVTMDHYWRHWKGEARVRPLSVRLWRKWRLTSRRVIRFKFLDHLIFPLLEKVTQTGESSQQDEEGEYSYYKCKVLYGIV